MRFNASGMMKHSKWLDIWALQRRADAGENLSNPIPLPPKYDQAD